MDTSQVSTAVTSVVATGLAALAGIATYLSSNVGLHARRVPVVDLATKRVAFWEQFLRVGIAASPDNEAQDQIKELARSAIDRIRDEADIELRRLSWNEALAVHRFSPHESFKGAPKIQWWIEMAGFWLFMLMAGVCFLAHVCAFLSLSVCNRLKTQDRLSAFEIL